MVNFLINYKNKIKFKQQIQITYSKSNKPKNTLIIKQSQRLKLTVHFIPSIK